MIRRSPAPAAVALAALLLVLPPLAAQRPALGPVDGAGLPPTDTGRVAVGMTAPDFTLEAFRGPPVTLSAFRGQKNVILVFYRGHW
jgi:cytochrome oxidase Cu insertion factor (SCO1/SenC/PrrC family)